MQVALEAAGRYKDDAAMSLVRRLLRAAPPTLRADVLCVVQMALQNGTLELGLLGVVDLLDLLALLGSSTKGQILTRRKALRASRCCSPRSSRRWPEE